MSDEEELRRIREQRIAQLQQQQAQQQNEMAAQQEASFNAQKAMVLAKILSSEARSRMANIKMARPEYAEMLEMQLIQAYQAGSLKNIPISDEFLKSLLAQLQQSQKRERKIKFM